MSPKAQMQAGEIGQAGTRNYAGFLYEEYLPALRGAPGVEIFDEMRRSDPQVAMTLRALTLPIIQATWTVNANPDDPDLGEEIAHFVETALFDELADTWTFVVRHALWMLPFGFSILEKVWKLVDLPETLKGTAAPEKVLLLDRLAPRHPRSIFRWETSDGQPGVTQVLPAGGTPSIPMDKLVVFTNEREADNLAGISILRPAYKPWVLKDNAEKTEAMGLERGSMGVSSFVVDYAALGAVDQLAKDAHDERCLEIGQHLQANEIAAVVVPLGITWELVTPAATAGHDALGYMERQDKMIAANILAQFLNLGQSSSGSGSRAVGEQQRGPFDMQLMALAQEIGETIEHSVIRELVDANYGPRPGYPMLTPEGIKESNLVVLATVVAPLVAAGLIRADEPMETWLRKLLGAPDADPTTVREAPKAPSPFPPAAPIPPDMPAVAPVAPVDATPPVDAPVDATVAKMSAGCACGAHAYADAPREPGTFWRDATPAERHVAFAQIDHDLAQAKDDFLRRCGEVAQEMAAQLATDAAAVVGRKDLAAVKTLKAPKAAKLASRIKGELAPLVAYGRQTVKDEAARAVAGEPAPVTVQQREAGVRGYATPVKKLPVVPPPDPIGLDLTEDVALAAYLATKSQQQADAVAASIEAGMLPEVLRLIKTGATEDEAAVTLGEVATKAADRGVLRAVGQMLSEAFGLGRGAEIAAQTSEGDVLGGTYSALLDASVCEACEAHDGEYYAVDSPEFELYSDGNSGECFGADRCRCLLLLDYQGSAPPTFDDLAGMSPEERAAATMPGFNPAAT